MLTISLIARLGIVEPDHCAYASAFGDRTCFNLSLRTLIKHPHMYVSACLRMHLLALQLHVSACLS